MIRVRSYLGQRITDRNTLRAMGWCAGSASLPVLICVISHMVLQQAAHPQPLWLGWTIGTLVSAAHALATGMSYLCLQVLQHEAITRNLRPLWERMLHTPWTQWRPAHWSTRLMQREQALHDSVAHLHRLHHGLVVGMLCAYLTYQSPCLGMGIIVCTGIWLGAHHGAWLRRWRLTRADRRHTQRYQAWLHSLVHTMPVWHLDQRTRWIKRRWCQALHRHLMLQHAVQQGQAWVGVLAPTMGLLAMGWYGHMLYHPMAHADPLHVAVPCWMALAQWMIHTQQWAQHMDTVCTARRLLADHLPNCSTRTGATPVLTGHVSLECVRVRHPLQPDQWLLDDVSLDIPAGTRVGMMGATGAGKSTLLRLILGIVQPEQGRILLDHQPLNRLSLHHVRRQWGVVMQNSQIIPGTIWYNLSGQAPLSLEATWELAQSVDLADTIRALPMRMFTRLTPHGADHLSGGEMQKLLLGRALAHNPCMLLLDEATSALDHTSQRAIQAHLATLPITQLVIAHHLEALQGMDRVYRLEAGRIKRIK